MDLVIVTPTRRLVEGVQVDSVKIPSTKGELEILPGHVDLMALLGTGELTFTQQGKKRRFAVSYGFLEVKNNHVLVLAETCEEASEINKSRAETAKQKATDALGAALTPEQFKKYQAKLHRAVVRIDLAS